MDDQDVADALQELAFKHPSEATFYNWKSKYGGVEASAVKRLKDLEAEHTELKKMFAELCIDNRAVKNLIEKKL